MSTDTLKISNGPWDAGTAIVNAVTGEGENFSDGDIWIFPTDDAGPVAICHKPGDAILIADAGTTFNRTGKTPSQLAERLEEAKAVIRMFNTERRNCQKRIEKDGSLNHGPTCLSTVKSEYTPPEEYCVICRANTFLTPPTNG